MINYLIARALQLGVAYWGAQTETILRLKYTPTSIFLSNRENC